MLNKSLRVLIVLIGLYALAEAARWLIHPPVIAKTLGVELPTGMGASSMISYFATLPFIAGLFSWLGVRSGKWQYLYTPLAMTATVMSFRILSGLLGYAPFNRFIVVGLVLSAIFAFAIYRFSNESQSSQSPGAVVTP